MPHCSCVQPRMIISTCMQAVNCGEEGQPCCPGNDDFRRCIASITPSRSGTLVSSIDRRVCTSCGDAGEPCCLRSASEEPNCFTGNVCMSGRCRPCGERGEPCCAGVSNGDRCFAASSFPSSSRPFSLRCTIIYIYIYVTSSSGGGTCESCGGTGEPCSQRTPTSDPFCSIGSVCFTGTCRPCGELGERCCPGAWNNDFCNSRSSFNLRVCSSNTRNGNCVECGGPGQPCCQFLASVSPTCTAGECVGGRCPGSPVKVRTSATSFWCTHTACVHSLYMRLQTHSCLSLHTIFACDWNKEVCALKHRCCGVHGRSRPCMAVERRSIDQLLSRHEACCCALIHSSCGIGSYRIFTEDSSATL